MDLLAFAVERYNYWIFIALMMMGLFVVIARGNLIKKMIGLNVFQTSVFIYYISIGKIAGGTAPIYLPEDLAARTAHGDGHAPLLPGKSEMGAGALHADESLRETFDVAGNDFATLTGRAHAAPDAAAIHAPPGLSSGPANDILAAPPLAIDAHGAADAAHQAAAIIYSNPLPHVLILTAIVVGVATTAVGLALVVRIREAYGTIEEDELESADDIAEFGHVPGKEGAAA